MNTEKQKHSPYEYMLLDRARSSYETFYTKDDLDSALKHNGLPEFLSDFPKLWSSVNITDRILSEPSFRNVMDEGFKGFTDIVLIQCVDHHVQFEASSEDLKWEEEASEHGPFESSRALIERIAIGARLNRMVDHVETIGPLGLRAYSSLYAYDKEGDIIGWLTVEGHEDGWYYETGNTIKEYPEGSIGEISGFNHEVAKLPDDREEILDLVFQVGKKKI